MPPSVPAEDQQRVGTWSAERGERGVQTLPRAPPARPDRRAADVLLGGEGRRRDAVQRFEEGFAALRWEGGKARPEDLGQVVVVGVPVGRDGPLDVFGELERSEASCRGSSPPAGVFPAVASHGEDIPGSPFRINPGQRPHDRQECGLGRVLCIVPPHRGSEVRHERRAESREEGVQRSGPSTLRLAHQLNQL